MSSYPALVVSRPTHAGGGLIRVMIVDDHPDLREIVATYLAADAELEIVGSANNAGDALALVERANPSVAIIDQRIGPELGSDLCRRIREVAPSTHCVIFTGLKAAETEEWSSAGGASAVISKGDDLRLLVSRIKEIASSDPP